jgi:predicted RNA-binding Zn-ribbon protein involved in translation (DUF1610 family)
MASVTTALDSDSGDDKPVLYCLSCGAGIPRRAFPEPGTDAVKYVCPECGEQGGLASVKRT